MAGGDSSEVADVVVGLATLIGTVAVALVLALSQAEGASPAEVLQFGFLATVGLGIASLTFGLPLTRVVMRAAISVGHQLAPRASALWIPSAVVLAGVVEFIADDLQRRRAQVGVPLADRGDGAGGIRPTIDPARAVLQVLAQRL